VTYTALNLDDPQYRARVLDHGSVRLVDLMPRDGNLVAAIVQAARVSYGPGTRTLREDRDLVGYLLEHRHTSPLEAVVLKFHAVAPISVARQWFRHRTHAYNEQSTRYTPMDDSLVYVPGELRAQDPRNRQGSDGVVDDPGLYSAINQAVTTSHAAYSALTKAGVAREVARDVLPLSTYTQFYDTVSLHNLVKFIELRSEAHAQQEVRRYSDALLDILGHVDGWVVDAVREHVLDAVHLSRTEAEVVRNGALERIGRGEDPGEVVGWSRLSKRQVRGLLAKFGLVPSPLSGTGT
jgi:thymidylate synthase (FAD)